MTLKLVTVEASSGQALFHFPKASRQSLARTPAEEYLEDLRRPEYRAMSPNRGRDSNSPPSSSRYYGPIDMDPSS